MRAHFSWSLNVTFRTVLTATTATAACALSLLAPATAGAGVIINSIDVTMVSTNYDARSRRASAEAAFASALSAFDNATTVCSQELSAMTDVTYRGTCGGGRSNFAAKYTITGSVEGSALFEFGLDWGRGGFISATGSGEETALTYLNEDIWWRENWNNEDVKGRSNKPAAAILLTDMDQFTLTLLGFERCCDGVNSGRYQHFWNPSPITIANETGPATIFSDPLASTPGFQTSNLPRLPNADWNTLAVNAVPAPASLPLVALGALLLTLTRQRRGTYPAA